MHKRGTLVIGLVSILLTMALGCSDESTAPTPESRMPDLGSPYAMASWQIEGETCASGQFCLTSIEVLTATGGTPKIQVRVSGDYGLIAESATMSRDDFDQYLNLVQQIIQSRSNANDGCVSTSGVSESVFWFAGDAGWGAGIEGCDDQLIEELRTLNLELLAKYFSQD